MKIWPFDPYAEASGGHQISGAELDLALEPIRKIRSAVGMQMDVMIELHGLWDVPAACRIAHALEPFEPYWIEDPVRVANAAALAEVQATTATPLAVGETLAGLPAFRDLIAEGGARVAIVDLAWVGGITQARKVAALAEAFERPVAPHDCTGPVVYTAGTHLSLHAPNAILQEHVRAFATGWYTELVTELPVDRGRHDHAADRPRPGHGVAARGTGTIRRSDPHNRGAPMRQFEPGTRVRVMQEDWGVFQNLPATCERFRELTGVEVELTFTKIPEMWELMERSFTGEDPPFDLVGVDDLLLIQAARSGHVAALDEMIAADDYSLDDFTPQAVAALSDRGSMYGLPYCDVSNVLYYRADLFEKHGVAVPETLDELTEAAVAIQAAVRAEGIEDFSGITLRGAPNCGLNFWIIGSTWGPSWGVRWYDDDGNPTLNTPELRGAVEHYCDLLWRAGPVQSPEMTFIDCTEWYAAGHAGMIVEPANEASILYDSGGPIAEGTRTALMPVGPLGTRHVGLYCPPYAIPSGATSKPAAWELAKFLCAPEQVLDDALKSGFVEVSRSSVMADTRFAERFRPELLEHVRQSRQWARGERPVTQFGMEVGNRIADQIVRALRREVSVTEALAQAELDVAALGNPEGP